MSRMISQDLLSPFIFAVGFYNLLTVVPVKCVGSVAGSGAAVTWQSSTTWPQQKTLERKHQEREPSIALIWETGWELSGWNTSLFGKGKNRKKASALLSSLKNTSQATNAKHIKLNEKRDRRVSRLSFYPSQSVNQHPYGELEHCPPWEAQGNTTRDEVGFLHRETYPICAQRWNTDSGPSKKKRGEGWETEEMTETSTHREEEEEQELKRGWRNLPEKTPLKERSRSELRWGWGQMWRTLVPQAGQWLVQFRDWRLCWCAECRSPVEQKFCNRKLREKRLRSCWIIKLAGKDGPNLNFWVKSVCGHNADKGRKILPPATFQKEVKPSKERAMQSSSVSNRGVNRKSKLLPQFQPEVAIMSSASAETSREELGMWSSMRLSVSPSVCLGLQVLVFIWPACVSSGTL